jgi:hypothetical protein
VCFETQPLHVVSFKSEQIKFKHFELGRKEEKLITLPHQSLIEFQYMMTVDNKKDLKLNTQTSPNENEQTKDNDNCNISNNNSNQDSIEPQTPEKNHNCTPTKLMINKLLSPRICKEHLFSAKVIRTHNSTTNVEKNITSSSTLRTPFLR